LAPEFADLAGVVRVIDVPKASGGRVLRVHMNGESDEAIAFLAPPGSSAEDAVAVSELAEPVQGQDWRWRMRMAEQIARRVDADRLGVAGMYIFGSTKNATAGPGSDIDLLVHVRGTPEQRRALSEWLAGWSACLAELNYLRTGTVHEGLLDVHFVTDEDIATQTSYAAKIGAVTDAARRLPLGPEPGE
jgi:hypothetical protein